MAEAPGGAGAGGGAANAQAAIAKHAAVTQAGGAADAAVIARVEDAIKSSPMGWLQSMLGEVDSRGASERGAVQGKIDEHANLVSTNKKDAPKDAGPPPAPHPPAQPAVLAPAAGGHMDAGPSQHPATGGAPMQHAPLPASAPAAHAAALPAAAPAPTIAGAVASAGGDSQLDAILNAYTPKGQQSTQMLGRIKQMGDIAQGFNGQLDTYVARGGAVEHGIAATANFLGAGKDVSAVWATNPYRKVHGVLGGIMTGLSAVKNVCSVVGNICGKLGIVLTVIGLLGMIFPPIGIAIEGIARVLNVVGVICTAVAFALSGVLTGLNGVVLAQQIGSGASAEEKAATADLMMSEANEASSGFINMAMIFGPRFISGMLGSSKGVVSSLMRRAKGQIGRVSIRATGNVKLLANKLVRKMGFGGAAMERVGGAWKDNGFVARTQAAFEGSRVGKVFNGAPAHIEAVQEKLMARYGNTAFARGLDRVGAWGGSTARRFDLEEKVGNLGTKSGAYLGAAGAETAFGKRMAAAAEQSELDTRKLAMQTETRDAAHLEETRWRKYLKQRQAANPDEIRSTSTDNAFIKKQGARVHAEATESFESNEAKRATTLRVDEMRKARFERRSDEFYENKTSGLTGENARDRQMDSVHHTRERRYELEAQYKPQEHERIDLIGKKTRTAEEDARLTTLNGELKPLDEARRLNKAYETDLSGIASGTDRARKPEYKNWHDVGSNVWEATMPVFEMTGLKNQSSAWEKAEQATLSKQISFDKGAAKGVAAGRGGHGTYAEIAANAQHAQMADFSAFVRSVKPTPTMAKNVRGMLSGILSRPTTPIAHAPTPSPSPSPSPSPTPGEAPHPHGETMTITPQVPLEPVTGAPPEPATPANVAMAAMDQETGEALPYWPSMMPEFEHAQSDFGWMRKVAVEFKKAQIDGKQKAVDTLAVYGRYQEYAKLRAAAAQKHAAASQTTAQSAQQNVDQAGQSETHAGQGEAKQGEAKGAASDRAAVDLPEPESRGFWGRVLGAVKRWAKDKAAQVFGWIQEKIASVILKGLCGVSMGDMRDYAGALKRQQAAAHGVAGGAAASAAQTQQNAIKLGADATKEAQSAADAVGECDRNIMDADNFMADVSTFEQQLAEEKAHAQAFIGQLHAEMRAQHAEQAAHSAAHTTEAHAEQTRSAVLGGAASATTATTATTTTTAAAAPPPPPEVAASPGDSDVTEIHTAAAYVGSQTDSLTGQIEARAADYHNQLALALTNHTGKDQQGHDLQGPAKKASKAIVDEFKTAATHTKADMDGFQTVAIDPSQSRRIADAIIQSADHLEASFAQSQQGLDDLFERTYAGIRDGKRTLKSRMLDGDSGLNHTGDQIENKVIDHALPVMDTAWSTASAPIAVPAAPAAPAKMAKSKDGESAIDDGKPANTDGAGKGVPFQADMERAFGTGFGDVDTRMGKGAEMDAMGARAVTQGNQVTFASHTPDKELVAHELTHVVQQRQGGPTAQAKPISAGERDGLESEADSIGARVAQGHEAGAVQGATQGTGLRDDAPGAVDVFPDPVTLQVLGDRFTLKWSRVGDKLRCEVHYEGSLAVDGPFMQNNSLMMDAQLHDPSRKLRAKTQVGASTVTVDVYGDGLTIGKFVDTTKPGVNARFHELSWLVGPLGDYATMRVNVPATAAATTTPGAAHGAPGGKHAASGSLQFRAVDSFTLAAARYGDANAASVTLTGSGDTPNPQAFEVPLTGSADTIAPKVVANDGRNISFDLNGDGKVDLTLVHTVRQVNTSPDGKNELREHHFRQFDKDGVLIGTYTGGMLYINGGPVKPIPHAQSEDTNAPDVSKEAPVTRAPMQGDELGELPQALVGPGGVFEMRVDGDGDRSKELVLRFKGLPVAGNDKAGQIRVEVIQLSSVQATSAAQSATFDVTADAVKALGPSISQVADGHSPCIIDVIQSTKSDFGATLQMKLFPPVDNATAKQRAYGIELGGKHVDLVFPAETAAVNPLVKDYKAAASTGGVSRFEVTLGEFHDRFWFMIEAQPDGKSVFSIAAINGEGPVAARGAPLAKVPTSYQAVASGPLSFGIDLDKDGKPDLQVFDALSAPTLVGTPGATLAAERDHVLTVAGPGFATEQRWSFFVRNGKFITSMGDDYDGKSADKPAAAAATSTQILADQASQSRTLDDKGNVAKEGDVNAVMSRLAGALTAERLKAKQAGLISDKLYTAWEKLSEDLINLGPQAKANKIDAALQKSSAADATAFYAELSAVAQGETKSHTVSSHGDSMTTTKNDITGERGVDGVMSGPGLRLPGEITAGNWASATADFQLLVSGLDTWIGMKMAPGSDAQKQQQYLVGMQGKLGDVSQKPGVVRINAAFQPDKSYNTNTQQWGEIPLMLFSWKEKGKWWLQDVTNPGREPFLDRVDAKDGETAPPLEIFQQLDYAKHFPKGLLHYQIPGGQGGQIITTERTHWWEFAQWIGLGLAAVGLTLATFGADVPILATASAVAFAGSGVAGAVYAGGDLYERAKHGDLEPTAVVMDLAQIVAGMFMAGAAFSGDIVASAAAAGRGAEGAVPWTGAAARIASVAQRAYVPCLAGATAADAVNLMAMGVDTRDKIKAIMNGPGGDGDKRAAVLALVAQTMALGGITILSIKGSMPEILSGRPSIVIDIVNGIPIARTNSIEIGGSSIKAPVGDANAQASARWQSHGIEEAAAEGNAGAKKLLADPEFMAGYKKWMEQPDPKVIFDATGKPKANFSKGSEPSPAVQKQIQEFVDTRGVGISLYEKAWAHTTDLQKVEDAVAKTGGAVDLQPGTNGWREQRPNIVKAVGGGAEGEAMVSRYERMRLGANAGNPKEYLAERDHLRTLLPDSEVERIRGLFPEYEVYVTGSATQTTKQVTGAISDIDCVVVVPKGSPPELMGAIEARARGQAVRPDPAFLQSNGLDPNHTIGLDVKVMTPEQFFGFTAASGGKGRTPLNFTRIDASPAELELARARANAGATHWMGPQKTGDLDQLYKNAEPARVELDGLAKSVAGKFNGESMVPGLKGRPRAQEKIDADYGGDASRITDLARGSIVFDKFTDLEHAATEIEGRVKVVRKKDRFASPADGYRDVLYNVEMSNGHVGELQLQLRAVQQVKEGAGHKLYEQIRSIEAKAKLENRPLTPEEAAQTDALRVDMKSQYDTAFDSTKGQ